MTSQKRQQHDQKLPEAPGKHTEATAGFNFTALNHFLSREESPEEVEDALDEVLRIINAYCCTAEVQYKDGQGLYHTVHRLRNCLKASQTALPASPV